MKSSSHSILLFLIAALSIQNTKVNAAWSYQTPWYDKAREYSDLRTFAADHTSFENEYFPYNIWPKGLENKNNKFIQLETPFHGFSLNLKTSLQNLETFDILVNAVERYNYFTRKTMESSFFIENAVLENVDLEVFLENQDLNHPENVTTTDHEKYDIAIQKTDQSFEEVSITANNIFGVIHALTSLSQLSFEETEIPAFFSDEPKYAYRGLLIDTSRHFIGVHYIKRIISTMELNKLNVFHWHLADDQTFSVEIPQFRNNKDKVWYTKNHGYTESDVKEVIRYARYRGVKVIPEIDTPGHTQSWNRAKRDLTQECFDDRGLVSSWDGPLDVTKNSTYEFLKTIFEDTRQLFPDSKYIHLGLDEVRYQCWDSNPGVKTWMKENGIESYYELEEYYLKNVIEIAYNSGGFSSMMWEDPIYFKNSTLRV